MKDYFRPYFDEVVLVEGGYSDHPSDAGGKTMYGITEAVARSHGYRGRMIDMPLSMARAIYRTDYWDRLRLDDVAVLAPLVAKELFDTGINCGVGNAGRFLQRALNAFNQQGKLYGDLTIDGAVGPNTISKLGAYFKTRGTDAGVVLLRALNAQQGVYYITISETRGANEDFTFGWFRNRVA